MVIKISDLFVSLWGYCDEIWRGMPCIPNKFAETHGGKLPATAEIAAKLSLA